MVSLYESCLRFLVECIDTFRLWLKPNKNNAFYTQTYVCVLPVCIFDKKLCSVPSRFYGQTDFLQLKEPVFSVKWALRLSI
jgi:hypothetical protein